MSLPSFFSVSWPESKSTSPGSEMTIRLWRMLTTRPSFVSVSSLRLQLLEARLDELELARALLVRVERLLALVEVGLHGAHVDAHRLELLGQRVDFLLGVGELRRRRRTSAGCTWRAAPATGLRSIRSQSRTEQRKSGGQRVGGGSCAPTIRRRLAGLHSKSTRRTTSRLAVAVAQKGHLMSSATSSIATMHPFDDPATLSVRAPTTSSRSVAFEGAGVPSGPKY